MAASFVLIEPALASGGGGLPWERPLEQIQESITGPVAGAIALAAVAIAGGMLIFGGELNDFARRLCYIVLVAGILLGATQIVGLTAHQQQPKPVGNEADWRERLEREQDEQILRLLHQQRMARLQARDAAYDSPIAVSIGKIAQAAHAETSHPTTGQGALGDRAGKADLYAAALRAGSAGQQADPNNQAAKTDFFNQSIADLGYLPNRVVPQQSRLELKRGSVIPATLVTGINSDLPGRITAQVSQNVYDSATGHRLLVPQGAKLFGRYDSNVSFGQNRVLVIWTDLIFPNGSTLQIGGMAGVDAQGYGGFRDQVDNKYLQTFGSAVLIALIGTGIDMAVPESSTRATQDTASDAARRNFAESFGRIADRTISRNLNVQPTLTIRPGYRFTIIVEQDIIFPNAYR